MIQGFHHGADEVWLPTASLEQGTLFTGSSLMASATPEVPSYRRKGSLARALRRGCRRTRVLICEGLSGKVFRAFPWFREGRGGGPQCQAFEGGGEMWTALVMLLPLWQRGKALGGSACR